MDKKKVMVVDDDPGLTKVMRIYFENSGFEVHIAPGGHKALAELEGFNPDLIILDVHMPKMDGVMVCKSIRATAAISKVPIIAITGYQNEEKRRQILNAGANAFVTKPVDMSRLLKQVKELIAATPA